MTKLIVPKDFVFVTATAAYQIEGAVNEGGRGPSIWDEFSHRKGKIFQDQNGDVACDQYHRYPEDVSLMQEMGVNAYRLSLSWSRIIPDGTGEVNQEGLDFANYAEVVARELGDRIERFITLNEPWEHCVVGHFLGEHAPGVRKPWAYWKVMHHQLLGHGLAMERIRAICPNATVGITNSYTPIHPVSDREKDHRTAAVGNDFLNFITMDPVLKGHYPEDLSRRRRCIYR